MPRSPRATMIESDASRMASKFCSLETGRGEPGGVGGATEGGSARAATPLPSAPLAAHPSWFSTLLMILTWDPPSPSTDRMYATSEPLRTNEAATKSIAFGTPHCRKSSSSFAVRVGRSTTTPGRLTFLRSPRTAVFMQRQRTVPAAGSVATTFRTIDPSAHRISLPGLTSSASFLYDMAMRPGLPGLS